MSVAARARRRPKPAAASPARRSFTPRYPAWLTAPSLALLRDLLPRARWRSWPRSRSRSRAASARHLHVRTGRSSRQVSDPLYLTIFGRTLVMAAGGTLLDDRCRLPDRLLDGALPATYKLLALLLIVVPFWTSFLIRTYALKIILDPHGYLAAGLSRHRHPLHEVRGRDRPRLQLPAAVHPARLRVARADGLDARRGRHRPRRAAVHGVPPDHAAADAARPRHRRAAGVHPDDAAST